MIAYVRQVDYLSPSSLRHFEQDPVDFYFARMGPPEYAQAREQEFPAAVGCAFDAHVKRRLADKLGLACPDLKKLLESVKSHRGKATEMGHALCEQYMASGAGADLESAGLSAVEVRPDTIFIGEVPVLGFLDAVIASGPFDWKVKGANKPGEYSPTPLYCRMLDTHEGPSGPHPKWDPMLCMEEINPDWATQLAIYSWLLGREAGIGAIDELIVGKGGHLRVAQFRAPISKTFATLVKARLAGAWTAIRSERVVPHDIAELGEAAAFGFRRSGRF